MTNNITSVGEDIQEQIKRVQELKAEYLSLPNNVGFIGASLMQVDIDRAIKALAEGDIVEILRSYEALKGIKE